MSADPIRAIADAVLYEGYILWPYRRSALKNQRRFNFGGVYPPAHTAQHPDDPSLMRTEVLVRGPEQARVQITVRFLHLVERTVARRSGDRLEEVDELRVDGELYLSWEEATEREVAVAPLTLSECGAGHTEAMTIPGGSRAEPLRNRAGDTVGELRRCWEELAGGVHVEAVPVAAGLHRLTVKIINATAFPGGERSQALRRTLCSTHALLRVAGGRFVSATDPPAECASAASAGRNSGLWPVLVGEPGDEQTMLASPIILEDYPRVAPESPGDLFDGGEIDGLLVLNILALTEAEKAEMAASDPRAREILERTEALTPEQILRLHGAVRDFGLAR